MNIMPDEISFNIIDALDYVERANVIALDTQGLAQANCDVDLMCVLVTVREHLTEVETALKVLIGEPTK